MSLTLIRFNRYFRNNKWELFFYIILISFTVFIGIYLYYSWLKTYFLNNQIDTISTNITNIEKEIMQLKKGNNYQKHVIAKYLQDNVGKLSWLQSLTDLISIFDQLVSFDKNENMLILNDFFIDTQNIKLKGKTSKIQYVYASGGIIDKFIGLKFIERLQIPSYNKTENSYDFNLDAKININGRNKK